ncbi:MAG: microcystin degradation protein MlrC [Tagaea sp. CACIAM 22H2]|nr:microcystin degradation protein MlrC [Tagaea sp. CACIAM 22H2]
MKRVLIVECMQEISSFNPLPSGYENFTIQRGGEMLAHRGANQSVAGAVEIFEAAGVEPVPTMSAFAGAAGILSADGWRRLSEEVLAGVRAQAGKVDGVYFSLHGAMGAVGDLDPEGYLLAETRKLVGPGVPIVISLDLHGILTDKMLRNCDGFAVYRTYPHVDFADTGRRAGALLLRLMEKKANPAIARVVIPALVRGDELITKNGCYGELLRECLRLEREGVALAAGIMIGNPFTDVPELCSQVLIMTDGDKKTAEREALRLAGEFWERRFRMQGKLISIERAIAQARSIEGSVIFTDAADATSSGASGDSVELIRHLRAAGYTKRVLAPVVDAAAAQAAHKAGVGATIDVSLGGSIDPKRFTPMKVKAKVKSLSDGETRFETMKARLPSGPTAVLTFDNFTVVAMSLPACLFDRAIFYANGLDPEDFDLTVVKSPHTEHHMFDAWVDANFNVDAPGATSANLPTLGHTICARPIYPLDPDVTFKPKAAFYPA